MSGMKSRGKIWIIIGVIVLISGLVVANITIKREPKGKR